MKDTTYLVLIELSLLIAVVALFVIFPPTPSWLAIAGIVIGLLMGILIYDLTVDIVRKHRAKRIERRISPREFVERASDIQADARAGAERSEVQQLLESGRRLLKEGNAEAALEKFRAARDIEPSSSRVWNHLGLAHSKMGYFEEALDAYQRAIALDFRNPSAHFNLALTLERLERYEEALEAWKNYEMVGRILHEREDLIIGAQKRIRELEAVLAKSAKHK